MRNLAAPGWLFAFGLLTALPAGVAAQNDTGQPVGQEDNTSYGTTSAEFLLLGAGARGTALGGSFAAIATDISSLYYNPAGAALIEKAGLLRRDMQQKKDLEKYEARVQRIEQKLNALAERLSQDDPDLAKALRTAWQLPARSLAFRNAEHRKKDG